jgi:hypothetical protein
MRKKCFTCAPSAMLCALPLALCSSRSLVGAQPAKVRRIGVLNLKLAGRFEPLNQGLVSWAKEGKNPLLSTDLQRANLRLCPATDLVRLKLISSWR